MHTTKLEAGKDTFSNMSCLAICPPKQAKEYSKSSKKCALTGWGGRNPLTVTENPHRMWPVARIKTNENQINHSPKSLTNLASQNMQNLQPKIDVHSFLQPRMDSLGMLIDHAKTQNEKLNLEAMFILQIVTQITRQSANLYFLVKIFVHGFHKNIRRQNIRISEPIVQLDRRHSSSDLMLQLLNVHQNPKLMKKH